MSKEPKARMDRRGLTGNTGLLYMEKGGMIHINAPYSSNDGVFVLDRRGDGTQWLRMSAKEAKRRHLEPIKCNCCKRPATSMGHMWPYVPNGTVCDSQQCHDKDREGNYD